MGEITVPVPNEYEKLAERLDKEIKEDVYIELGKRIMDVIHETSSKNIQQINEGENEGGES